MGPNIESLNCTLSKYVLLGSCRSGEMEMGRKNFRSSLFQLNHRIRVIGLHSTEMSSSSIPTFLPICTNLVCLHEVHILYLPECFLNALNTLIVSDSNATPVSEFYISSTLCGGKYIYLLISSKFLPLTFILCSFFWYANHWRNILTL